MQQPVTFPDIEAYLVTYLRAELPDFIAGTTTVGVSVPDRDPWPARLVVVRRDGGPRDGHLERPRITIRAWAESDEEATDLALAVCALVGACPDGLPVTRADQLSGPSALPEENGRKQRTMAFQLTVHGSVLDPLPTPA